MSLPGGRLLADQARIDVSACEREPIQHLGTVQSYGVLLVLDEPGLTVRWASTNSALHLGVPAGALLGAPLGAALGAGAAARLLLALRDSTAVGSDPLALHLPSGGSWEITWQRGEQLVLVELVPVPATDLPSVSALLADLQHAMGALHGAGGAQALWDVASSEFRRITGYDRVMVYRFHDDDHGEVVGESCVDGLEPFLGLHYPASDIPRQARRLFLLNHLRQIADVDDEPVPVLGPPGAGPEDLDLTMSGLRSASPVHLAYLRNMGVAASLTLSLLHGTRLWGMITCHHGTPRRVDAQLQSACRVLGQVLSLQAVARDNQDRHAHRARLAEVELQLVARMSTAASLIAALGAAPPLALSLAAADGLLARIDGQTVSVGSVPGPAVVEALLERLREDDNPGLFACDALGEAFGGALPATTAAAGVLAVPLSAAYGDFILWFRRERVVERIWAGNPDKAVVVDLTTRPGELRAASSPRTSFAAWSQGVRGHSAPWRGAEVDTGRSLAAAIPELLLGRARDRLSHVALHDTLTGLPNRALLADRTAHALARQQRSGQPVAMLLIDLDRFKLVNDSRGHASGDVLLQLAGQRLQDTTRDTDTTARVSGDEFLVLCEDITAEQAAELADRIVVAFRAPFLLEGRPTVVTASVGVALAVPGTSPAELLRDADTAMYRAKHSGRNVATAFTQDMHQVSVRRVEIETGLQPALERGDLRLDYQPVHDVSGTLTGFEALARWPLAGRGLVSPTEFIPTAEETGLIEALTAWAMDEGCAALAGWRRRRPDLDLTLAVNITAAQMTGGVLSGVISETMRRHALPSSALCLEITESALITDEHTSMRFLHDLRDLGVRLSIDDFGTGFSSLSYLTKLPVHELKIDQAFIAGLPSRPSDVTVVAAVVALAHQLGLQALAEGVETDEQFTVVRRLGCDLVQGYLLGRPMPASEIDRFLASRLAGAG